MQAVARPRRRHLLVPIVGLIAGLLYFAGFAAGGEPITGVAAFGVMLAFSAAAAFAARRSDAVRGLFDHRDERLALVDLRATAVTAIALIVAVFIGFLYSVARGGNGAPYDYLGAIGGLVYVGAAMLFAKRG